MEQEGKSKVESLLENVLMYGEQRKDLFILDAAERSSKGIAQIIASILIAVLIGLVLLFASIAAAWAIGLAIDDMPMGFVYVAAFYMLALIITLILNKDFIQTRLTDRVIKKLMYDTGN